MTARNTFLENKYLMQNTSIGVDKLAATRKKIGRLSSPHPVIVRPRNQQQGIQRGTRTNVHPYDALTVNLYSKELNASAACLNKKQLKQEKTNQAKGETRTGNRGAPANENLLTRKSPEQSFISGNNRAEPAIKFPGSDQEDKLLREKIVSLAPFKLTKDNAEKSQGERRRSSSFCLDDEATTCSSIRHRKQRRHSYF